MSAPWQPEDLSLAFLTCPREPAYFAATLASLLLSDPLVARLADIAVAVDAPDLGCMGALAGHGRVRWVARTEEENARIAPYLLHRRACHNYWRAIGLAEAAPRAAIVCEDDLVFRDGWLGMLLECLDEMQADGLEDFLLAAYSPGDHEAPPLRRGRCYSSYVAHSYYGGQAMIFSRGEIAPVRELVWRHGVVEPEEPYDLLVKRRAIDRQHLYTTRHSLVQHLGVQSTGLGWGHTSPSFGREWPRAEGAGSPRLERARPSHGTKIQARWKVFTVIYRPTPLLAHFVRHYAALGFTDIVIAAAERCAGMDWAAVREEAAGAEVHVEPLYGGVFDTVRDTAILNAMKARHVETGEEWSAQADLDEFYEYPLPLTELAAAAGEANCVQGFFVDRVAADGSLPAIREDVPIAGQFPVETRLTKRIGGGYDRKLLLTRGFQNPAAGHHSMPDEQLFPQDGRVLHYKWNAIVLEHLAERIATRGQTGYRWTAESERFLDYWQQHGRIDFADCS